MSASIAHLRPNTALPATMAAHAPDCDMACDAFLPLTLEPSLRDLPRADAAPVAALAALAGGAMAVLAMLVAVAAG